MYFSRFLLGVAAFLFLVSWMGFVFPGLFLYGRRSAALTRKIGEQTSKKVAKFVGVPIVFLAAVALLFIGIDQEIVIQKAQNGNADAQYRLATHFYKGDFQAKKFESAISWYWRAAGNGHAKAKAFIETFLKDYRTVISDEKEAFSGYRTLADAGVPAAQFHLAECYHRGMGIPQDDNMAFGWYEKAAKSGHPNTSCMLGLCYSGGVGTKKTSKRLSIGLKKERRRDRSGARFSWGCCILNTSDLNERG